MDYKRYFEILIEENKKRKDEFPENKIFNHSMKDYYTNPFKFEEVEYNFVISSQRSEKYGEGFIGFIVEVQSTNDYYKELEKYKDIINQELGKDLIIQWLDKEKSPGGTRWNIHAKLEADIEDKSKWKEYAKWQIDTMIKFLKVFPKYTKNLKKEENMKIKNIMLYGAPGVGKTHNYKRLITMIENGESEKTIFDTISKNDDTKDFDDSIFEMIKNEKRIEFVTFHQSYSYEDFIEGFRPQDDRTIRLEDGIFKKLCDDAKINLLKSINKKEILFIDAINLLLKDKIENQENIKINLKRENSYFYIYDYNDKTIYFEKQNGDKSHSLSLKTLEKMYYEEANNIINGGLAPYYNPILEELLKLKNKSKVEKSELKNFYIIIDEINRGNISKIFGELITLIEEDKRDIYEVTLPYSKEKFKIPSNLYIIATMNSTDKSIATIDIALRRRFTFLKMKPNPKLVQNDNVRQLMKELNQYISKSFLGEDYQLGHSYFIGDDIDIEFIKEYKIKPLLEEYFYSEAITPDEIIKKAKSEYKEEVIKSSDIENKENQND
ncbi:McrB family protein [Aliarcobacter lanthieri]|uniref:McrB family protein n=1 Tax=Aliarcobacter lanthieri TaxID=1355374 RepID=UPI003AAC777A